MAHGAPSILVTAIVVGNAAVMAEGLAFWARPSPSLAAIAIATLAATVTCLGLSRRRWTSRARARRG